MPSTLGPHSAQSILNHNKARCGALLMLLLIIHCARCSHADDTAATTEPTAAETPPSGTRYVIYDSSYGSVNNQLNSLVSALTIANRIGAVTVVGPAFTPGGGSLLLGHEGRVLNLVTDFLDTQRLQSRQGVMTWEAFSETDDGKKLMTPRFAKYYFVREEERTTTIPRFYNRVLNLKPWVYQMDTTPLEDAGNPVSCEAILSKGNLVTNQCGGHESCRFILLDRIFTNLQDCTSYDPYWRRIRQSLIPSPHIRRAVSEYIDSVQHPIIAVHVRLVGLVDGTGAQFWYKLCGGLDRAVQALNQPKKVTIYVLGMKHKRERFRVDNTIHHLQSTWSKRHPKSTFTFVTCADVTSCGESKHLSSWARQIPPSTSRHLFQEDGLRSDPNSYFGTIFLEMWMSLKSDVYIGRNESTFSQSVHLWRQELDNKPDETSFNY